MARKRAPPSSYGAQLSCRSPSLVFLRIILLFFVGSLSELLFVGRAPMMMMLWGS